MSVESSYFIVDWATLQSMPKDADLAEHFFLGSDEEDEEDDEDDEDDDGGIEDEDDEDEEEEQAEGARRLDFGEREYYFTSWNFFMEFSDWLRPVRGKLDERIKRPFTTLFTAIGVLFDDNHASAALKSGVEFTDASWTASISPAEVKKLRTTVRSLDRRVLEAEFGRVLAAHPAMDCPTGKPS